MYSMTSKPSSYLSHLSRFIHKSAQPPPLSKPIAPAQKMPQAPKRAPGSMGFSWFHSESQKCKERTKNQIIAAWWLSFIVLIYNLHVFCNSDLQIYTKSLPALYRFQGSKICSNNSTVHGKGKRTPINRRESDHLNSRWTASAVPCSWQGLSWIDLVVFTKGAGNILLEDWKERTSATHQSPCLSRMGWHLPEFNTCPKNKLRLVEA